jgi:hypothetical protein
MTRLVRRLILPVLFSSIAMQPVGAMPARIQRQNRDETRSTSLYRLSFTLHVFESSQDRKREFVMTVGARRSGRVRAITRVPVREGTGTRYIDTGVKCDAEYQDVQNGIQLQVEMVFSEISSAAAQTSPDSPLVYEWQSQVEKAVAPNELTVLSSYDDEQTNRRYRLEVTAEKLR